MQLFKDNNGRLKTKAIFWVAVCIVIIVCVAYFLLFYFLIPVNMEKRGQFGDMFGFIGALFSGLAFAGLIVTMLQQREDLQNQKDEIYLQRQDLEAQTEALRLQKEEIAQTNKELKEQNKTIMLQRFENTFFNMLDFQMRLCAQVRYELVSGEKMGEDAIRQYFNDFRMRLLTTSIDYNNCISIAELDHVHRHWTQILKLIDQTDFLSKKEKNDYVGLICSHMSYFEMALYFYYCLSQFGRREAKSLSEKYALFRFFGTSSVFRPEHLSFLESAAYKVCDE